MTATATATATVTVTVTAPGPAATSVEKGQSVSALKPRMPLHHMKTTRTRRLESKEGVQPGGGKAIEKQGSLHAAHAQLSGYGFGSGSGSGSGLVDGRLLLLLLLLLLGATQSRARGGVAGRALWPHAADK